MQYFQQYKVRLCGAVTLPANTHGYYSNDDNDMCIKCCMLLFRIDLVLICDRRRGREGEWVKEKVGQRKSGSERKVSEREVERRGKEGHWRKVGRDRY